MKIAYFDCFSGISGNMILGALVDAGVSPSYLKEELKKINISNYSIKVSSVRRGVISAKYFEVCSKKNKKEISLKNILRIIKESKLEDEIKRDAEKIYLKIAEAEAKIHGEKIENIHFHEIGAIDTIVDIVGTLLGIKKLGIEKIYSSPLNLGKGKIECSHGILPVPAPATLEILKGIPVYSDEIEKELTTPTGAAIISTIASEFSSFPLMKIEKIGYGAGTQNHNFPNVLRIIIGEKEEYREENLVVLETNIDDMNPEIYEYVIEKLLKEGALDVYLTQILMKKTRPAVLLTVICEKESLEKMIRILFQETTTLGIRINNVRRIKLQREIFDLNTEFGKIKIKISEKGIKPEYEDCKKIAKKKNIPLREIYKKIFENKKIK
jgi:uncharacterized protein (TIGR00299 family) protein